MWRSVVIRRARGRFIRQQLAQISNVRLGLNPNSATKPRRNPPPSHVRLSGDDRDSEADGLEVRLDGGGGGRVRREGHRLIRGLGQDAGHLHRRQHQGTNERGKLQRRSHSSFLLPETDQ